MKNTLAIAIIILGGILIYGGYKDYSFADTIRFFTGQKITGEKDGVTIDAPPKPTDPQIPGVSPRITPGPGGLSS